MYLLLKRASASRPAGEWNDDDFDVLANGAVVGRIFTPKSAPVESPWMWTLIGGSRRPMRCGAGHGQPSVTELKTPYRLLSPLRYFMWIPLPFIFIWVAVEKGLEGRVIERWHVQGRLSSAS
jgi:hypothetical protein